MMRLLFIILSGILSVSSVFTQNFIRVNQIGYYTTSPKIAFLADMDALMFEIRKLNTGEEVYRADLETGKLWNQSGENIQVADFSNFREVGTYYIQSGDEKSYPFEIKDHFLFDSLSVWTLKAFYLWRSSTDIKEEYATFGNQSYARTLGHSDDTVYIHKSVAKRPVESELSAPKGWYDAGDYNKYVINAGISVHSLAIAYEMFPEYYKSQNLNIPESRNSIPDILDELKWEFDWLLNMQDPSDGSVYCKLSSLRFCGMVMPEFDKQDRYMIGKSTASALNFAAVMAIAARIYDDYDDEFPGFSRKALFAAERAWNWALKNNNLVFHNPEDVTTGEYKDDSFEDEFFWAASELFISTGKKEYYDKLDFFQQFTTPTWSSVNSLGLISLLVHLDDLSISADKEQIERKYRSMAEGIYKQYKYSAGKVPIRKFEWGSNGLIAVNGTVLGLAYLHFNDDKYLAGMISCLDYLLGSNPTDYCFVTHFGHKYPKNLHDRRCVGDNIVEPLPGYLVGGANPNQVSDCGKLNYLSVFPARCYLDEVCSYSTNEVAINWNAPLVLLVSIVENSFNR